jgi:hypothetical protein
VRASAHLRIELSVATGARIGDGQTSIGIGALSFLELSGWLVGFDGRLDRYQRLATSNDTQGPGRVSSALELALLGGRRVRLNGLAFDFLLGPAAALGSATTSQSAVAAAMPSAQTQMPGATVTHSSPSTVPRLLLACRLNFAALSTLRTFVSLEGEFGPARADGNDLPSAPRLPVWTLGLALGATVGTR